MKKAILILIVCIGLLFISVTKSNCDFDTLKVKGLCYEIEQGINPLVDYTLTKCWPAGGTEKGSVSFVLISEKPIFSIESSKKAWLLVAVAAVGKVGNDHSDIEIDEVFLSDANLMKQRKGFLFPGKLTRVLQRKVYNGEINIEQMYRQITPNLREKQIPKSKEY